MELLLLVDNRLACSYQKYILIDGLDGRNSPTESVAEHNSVHMYVYIPYIRRVNACSFTIFRPFTIHLLLC